MLKVPVEGGSLLRRAHTGGGVEALDNPGRSSLLTGVVLDLEWSFFLPWWWLSVRVNKKGKLHILNNYLK